MSATPHPNPSHVWHALEVDKTIQVLESNAEAGLSSSQVKQRLEEYGANELQESGGRSPLAILIDQFKNIMLLMLIAVAIVSAVLDIRNNDFPKDAIAISLIVVLNGILGYVQESRAEKALAALKKLSAPLVRVMRDGKLTEVAAKELVPGDIMLIEAGVQLAADGRIIEESNLQIRESALTGESHAVEKQADIQVAEETSLGDRVNLVYQGTEVTQGRAKVIVTGTGMQTELGKIAALLQGVESEPTPLQQRMSQLGNVLVAGAMILVALVVVGGVLRLGWDAFEELLQVSLSMAVAVVPEGLPAVITVTLALGTQRMVKRNALIRKLPAVETLGSVTTICSDKTGTLTQNKMVVQAVELNQKSLRVTGEGYAPQGEFLSDGRAIDADRDSDLQALLVACALCNDSFLQEEQGQWKIVGDPTEGALVTLAAKAGIQKDQWSSRLPRVAEFPFSSERKRMSVICRTRQEAGGRSQEVQDYALSSLASHNSAYLMFTKGSPELTLERCDRIHTGDRAVAINDAQRQQILEKNNQMASQGLRVLGFAYKPWSELPPEGSEETSERELVWLGLVGMLDAPRPEVRDAVARSREAGIRPIMITGDHQLTARAIGIDLGIAQAGDRAVTGQELERMSQADLEREVDQTSIYARVSPEHKLRIVQALQRKGKFVAMTGDGVNDAPALKQADIGIAMGITGTDVSKEASDMVLLDDNFATIVAATEEGRVVYTNIRRFIKYILGSNIGEVLTIAAAPILGLGGVPLSPLQILWMNLVTDGLPALALAVEPAEPNVMKRPPFSPRESIFARGLGWYMVRIGIIFAILSIILMEWAYFHTQANVIPNELSRDRWKTMVFTTLCLAQMGHALAIRSNTRLTIQMNPLSNPYVLGAVALTTVLQMLLIYVPPLRAFFGTHFITPIELLICFGFSSLMFVWIELEKLFINWQQRRKAHR
ncbi:MAG: Calcium-transporting ATPase [Chroococcidiopsis cubana SAG 39.79]|uniref:Magnesium-transporting ATPase n=1 Tax=Chroococcidiopsis cubana SAG 39.79 TaxID=388085 RepID=A0AB37UHG0_9CYAN|nr:cation-transporting P-type ATPase [Chroococcidiopsis cubana]MDZ4878773.1 Calcium-transporting ATPase [Chroococcidiopsis cubana SAG 39.79]PSB64591.1 magnesium-transporting ATPase [Chroococcidiopsis cubana CCALA 043]RUT10837.1 magnesium-transporting ATPase [Chroococcidiopsis cubana SAG 39.79]